MDLSCLMPDDPDMIGIMSEDLFHLVVSRATMRRELAKESYLFHRGDRVRSIFAVESGFINLTRFQENGAPLILQRAGPGTFLAEASVYSETYHCDALASQNCLIHEWDRAAFRKLLADTPAYSELWASHLAREVQSARYRSEILTRKNVAERFDCWLTWQGGAMPPKGRWKSIAGQIGVSPEAFYRELAKRRR